MVLASKLINSGVETPYSRWWPQVPFERQMASLMVARYKREQLYGGAAGPGKSSTVLLHASEYADNPDSHSLLIRKTYADLSRENALMDRAKQWWLGLQGVKWEEQKKRFTFPSGATISFGYMGDKNAHLQYQGAEFTMIGIDEAVQIPEYQLRYLHSRLRAPVGCQTPLRYILASNPGGVSHEFLKERYLLAPVDSDRIFLVARLDDNPYLDTDEYDQQLRQLDPVTYQQLRHGDWDATEGGGMFERSDFRLVDVAPPGCFWVRSWDLAATLNAGDYTAGALVGYTEGRYHLADMKAVRLNPSGVERLIADTAEQDGRNVTILVEQEPGSAGKIVMQHLATTVLPGYAFYPILPTGKKVDRARVVASAVANGLFSVGQGNWRTGVLDQFHTFPQDGMHDDMVDAVSQAVGFLSRSMTWAPVVR